MIHELHKRFPAIAQRLQISRWGAWKRLLCLLVSVGMLMSLCGCGNSGSEDKGSRQPTDYEIQESIRKQIDDTPIPKGYSSLIDPNAERWVIVSYEDGEAVVSIRASHVFTIPYVSELYFPIAQEAAEAAGATLTSLRVRSYSTNEDGSIGAAFSSWETKDGINGTIALAAGESIKMARPYVTLEELYEACSDFEDEVRAMIIKSGGSFE